MNESQRLREKGASFFFFFFGSRFISHAAKTGLSLLRNQTETLATQAKRKLEGLIFI